MYAISNCFARMARLGYLEKEALVPMFRKCQTGLQNVCESGPTVKNTNITAFCACLLGIRESSGRGKYRIMRPCTLLWKKKL